MKSLFEIHGIKFVVLDLPLGLIKCVVHLCEYQVPPTTVRVLRDVEYHIVVSTLEVIESAVELAEVERRQAVVALATVVAVGVLRMILGSA